MVSQADLKRQEAADLLQINPQAHDGLIRRICERFEIPDPAVSLEDAIAECRQALLQSLPAYQPSRAAFSTFAHQVVTRKMIKISGKARRHEARRMFAGTPDRHQPGPDRCAEYRELRLAVARMPRPMSRAIRMIYLERRTPPDVMRALRCNPHQLKLWIAAGLERLRREAGVV